MCRDDAFVSQSIPLTRILVQKIEHLLMIKYYFYFCHLTLSI
uniref:Uncharacterized protein n=1 Tax=Heterorhabditis bacteriophora TaxID=37862 RepID=A0A1I7WLG9_HETBA